MWGTVSGREAPQIFFYSLWCHFSDGWPSVKSLEGCVLDSNVWDPHSPAAKWWVTAPEGITHTAPLSSTRHIPAALGSVIGVIVWNCIKVIAMAEEVVPALWHMWSIVSLTPPTHHPPPPPHPRLEAPVLSVQIILHAERFYVTFHCFSFSQLVKTEFFWSFDSWN